VKWKEYCVLTEKKGIEAVAAIFHGMGCNGVIIEEPQYENDNDCREKWAVRTLPPECGIKKMSMIKAYFSEGEDVLEELKSRLSLVEEELEISCSLLIGDLQDEDWQNSWKKYYHTKKVGKRLVIKPSWEEYTPQENEAVVSIDPGMAFGTGDHASTRFCLELLEEVIAGGERVLDAGCGSGILSIAAAKLGASTVRAVDLDEVAVEVAKQNVAFNKLEKNVIVEEANAFAVINEIKPDIILANLTADILTYFIPAAAEILERGAVIIASGILSSRWPELKEIIEVNGLRIERFLENAEWVGVLLRKP